MVMGIRNCRKDNLLPKFLIILIKMECFKKHEAVDYRAVVSQSQIWMRKMT
jgi:hypothetical protein